MTTDRAGMQLLRAATTVSTGDVRIMRRSPVSFQATVTGTGSVGATVVVEASNDGVAWVTLTEFTLAGTATASDSDYCMAPYDQVRARVSAISGTGASVTVTMAG